ncbi:MAG: DUF1295 domain-containing protein [Chitinophagales bacterium]|nr:DUF1295 domain-containing protein [Chitinophagales bacterium]
MNLRNQLKSEGDWLFRHRGQLPILLLIIATPFILTTSYNYKSDIELTIIDLVSLLFTVAGFVIRAQVVATTPKGTSGRNIECQIAEHLNTSGMYSCVRHPLYVANFLVWCGLMIYSVNIALIVISICIFWMYYERIMYAEEQFLEKKFGDQFITWASRVPAFLPSSHHYTKPDTGFSLKTVLRREYSGWLSASISYLYIDSLIFYKRYGKFGADKPVLIAFVLVASAALALKAIKTYTSLLVEEDRS